MLLNCNTCTLIAFIFIPLCVCVCVSQGHVDEMWGLATHPSQNIFLTCGHDRQVCLWNTEEHKLDWCITLEVRFLNSNLLSLTALFIYIRSLLEGSLLHNSELNYFLCLWQEYGLCADFCPNGSVVSVGLSTGR